jgi:fumarate hydratase class II
MVFVLTANSELFVAMVNAWIMKAIGGTVVGAGIHANPQMYARMGSAVLVLASTVRVDYTASSAV